MDVSARVRFGARLVGLNMRRVHVHARHRYGLCGFAPRVKLLLHPDTVGWGEVARIALQGGIAGRTLYDKVVSPHH